MSETIDIVVDFYCDNFRSGIVPVPKALTEEPEPKRRAYILSYLTEVSIRKGWKPTSSYNPITIITAKVRQ